MAGPLSFFILATFPLGVLAFISPLKYQSSGLTFNDWVSLFTLCFAPVIAHVLAGVPTIVYLSQRSTYLAPKARPLQSNNNPMALFRDS
jgi:hypothetical protein